MLLATWNVNSIRARIENVKEWLSQANPDLVMLQEIKAQTETFPFEELKALGYHAHIVGQKSYNGVAILSKEPVEVVLDYLPALTGGRDAVDEQARYLEVVYKGTHFSTIYLPNGNPINTEKFPYKLVWMERLNQRAKTLLADEKPFVFAGDFNVCPLDKDCYSPTRFKNDALLQPESRDLWHGLINLGLTEAFRVFDQRASQYSYWDYTGGSYDKDNGVRIDHFMLSPTVADRLVSCTIDRNPRAKEKASDHTPVLCEIIDVVEGQESLYAAA